MQNIKLILFFLFFVVTTYAQDSWIKVKVTGFEDLKGKASIGLFNSPEGFPKKGGGILFKIIDVEVDSVEHIFTGLGSGEYALAIYHDENSNGEMDRNFLGMPTEDYVFSNYATGSFGPPSFEDAKFMLSDSVSINLDFNK